MFTLVLGLWILAGLSSAHAQTVTAYHRYDTFGREVGTINYDPDGSGPAQFAAVRTIYDTAGLVARIETGVLTSVPAVQVSPNTWTNFTIFSTEYRTYNTLGQLVRTRVVDSNGLTVSVADVNYDREGREGCSAVRMSSSTWLSPLNACSLSTTNPPVTDGHDRITKNVYDTDGRLRQIRRAVGVSAFELAEVTYDYSLNGQMTTVIDANGNRAQLQYDGHDRLNRWVFPSTQRPTAFSATTFTTAIATAGAVNPADDELYTYDNNGNRLTLTKRDGTVLQFTYDALNQVRSRAIQNPRANLPDEHERPVYYNYDLRGLQTDVRFDSVTGPGIINTYDGFGRVSSTRTTLIANNPLLQFGYDLNSNRTSITHPDGQVFNYIHDLFNRLVELRQGATPLVNPSYNVRGQLASVNRQYNAFDQTYTYDPANRLASLTHAYAANSNNVGWSFAYNAASQIRTETRDNDSYAWTPDPLDQNYLDTYVTNGLNQYGAIAGTGLCYDLNGNLTSDGTNVFLYDNENRLVERRTIGATNCATNTVDYSGTLLARLNYDPLGRLYRITDSAAVPTFFLNDGDALVMEYDAAGTILDRYVHGNSAGADDPLLWYPGSSVADTNLRNLYSDTRGSIVLVADRNSGVLHRNSYSEYGQQGTANGGRFQYTGQVYLEELGMYYYKARIYAPEIGRFLQTDPIGYEDQFNLYAYVGNDPINGVDPSGTEGFSGQVVDYFSDEWSNIQSQFNRIDDDAEDVVEAISEGNGEYFSSIPPSLGGGLITGSISALSAELRLAGQAASATQRANQVHSVLDPIAQSRRTTAVLDSSAGRIVAGGGRDLTPAQRAALGTGETAARARGAHAEVTALRQASATGARPRSLAATRRICSGCAAEIQASGGRLTSPTTATWRSRAGAFWDWLVGN